MNKKQKSSIILASLATIAVSGSLIAGATYALFTSESKTNIAVTSGKVSVNATIEDLVTYTGENLTGDAESDKDKIKLSTAYGLENGNFKNGGTAKYSDEDGTLTLDRMTPGDKVTFTINVKNESNVNTKYRTVIKTSDNNGLFEGLVVSIDGTSYNGDEIASPYLNLFPGDDPTDIKVEIDLPSDRRNIYQDMKCTIISSVEAVQGNAYVGGESVTNKTELSNAVTEGKPVSLSEEIAFDKGEWINVDNDVSTLTIYGNGKTLTANSESTVGGTTGRVINVEEHSNPLTITLVDLNIVGPTNNEYNRGISLYNNSGKIKVVLDNCTVSANHYALNVAGDNSDVEIVAKHSTFVGYAALQLWSKTNAVFTDCTFNGVNQWSGGSDDFATIVVYDSAAGSGLTFNNCTIKAEEQGTATEMLLDVRGDCTINCDGCKFYHSNEGKDPIPFNKLTSYYNVSSDVTCNITIN